MLQVRAAIVCGLVAAGSFMAGCKQETQSTGKGYRESEVTAIDARKILIDPKKHSGQVFKSNVKISSVGNGSATFVPIGSDEPLNLSVPDLVREKITRADNVYGKTRPIAIIFRYRAESTVVNNRACNGELLDVQGL